MRYLLKLANTGRAFFFHKLLTEQFQKSAASVKSRKLSKENYGQYPGRNPGENPGKMLVNALMKILGKMLVKVLPKIMAKVLVKSWKT